MSNDDTLFGGFFEVDLEGPLSSRLVHLAVQACVFSLLGYGVSYALKLPNWGLISIFLVAASLRDRMVALLDENRRVIESGQANGIEATLVTAVSLLTIFCGTFVGYILISLHLLPDHLETAFHLVLDSTLVAPGASLTDIDRFDGMIAPLTNNLSVMVTIFAVSIFYRAYGAILVLCWNAVVWATALSSLGLAAVYVSHVSPIYMFFTSCVAVLPHLLAEALGYCVVAIAGIFTSKAVTRYPTRDPRFRQIMGTVSRLILLATGLLLLGALLEGHYAPALLNTLL